MIHQLLTALQSQDAELDTVGGHPQADSSRGAPTGNGGSGDLQLTAVEVTP
jgi:hypothetical protein